MTDPAPWSDENRRGLAFAAAGAWDDAADAFATSVDALTRNEARDPAVHEALALVLANMAQACFRAGRTDDAIRHAQRACALRVALCGEDAVAVARSRSDLAVILAASGRLDESPALLARAIAAIEGSVGDEDLRLAVVLENAGRVALAAGQPATAEPFLLRLHGLLGAHEMSSDRADMLLALVFEARVDADVRAQIEAVQHEGGQSEVQHTDVVPSDVVQVEVVQVEADEVEAVQVEVVEAEVVQADAVPAREAAEEDSDWEDQPLRDAVVLTDALLRTTPTGNPVVRPELTALDPWGEALVDGVPAAEENGDQDTDDAESHDDIFGSTGIELTDAPQADEVAATDRRSQELHEQRGNESPPAAPDAPPAPAGGLGFVVQYGVPLESGSHPALSASGDTPSLPAGADLPAARDRNAMNLGDELELVPATTRQGEPAGIPAEPPAVAQVPAPAMGSTAGASQRGASPEQRPAARPTVHTMDAVPEAERAAPRAPRAPRVVTPPKKSRAGMIGGGIAAIGAVAAAAWYYMHGGF